MAGRGPAPKPDGERRRRAKPTRDWKPTPGTGWQHGDLPDPPDGLLKASREAWHTWLTAWFAAHWTPADLPGLRHLIRLYDQVERGEFQRASELRLSMDTYGISPKGQQDRRWKPPEEGEQKPEKASGAKYGHLRAVPEG
jgi:hypothetical protein